MSMRRVRELYEHYLRLPRLPFLALSLFVMVLIAVLVGVAAFLACPSCGPSPEPKYALSKVGLAYFMVIVFFALVIAPLAETLVFQVLPHKLFWWLRIDVLWLCALLSAVLFMAAHVGDYKRLMHVGVMGMLLYLLYAERLRVGARSPYIDVSLLHSAWNLFVVAALALW